MSDFKVKMHQNRFKLGLSPRPCWESLQRSHAHNWNKGSLLLRGEKGSKEGKEEKGEECRGEKRRRGNELEGKGEKKDEGTPVCTFKFSLEYPTVDAHDLTPMWYFRDYGAVCKCSHFLTYLITHYNANQVKIN